MHVCDTWSSPERNLSNQFWHCRSFKPFFHNFLWACDAFFLCENKKAKYDDNVPFDFPFFNENYATDQKIFFTDWQLNCQLSNNKMCFTFGLRLKIQLKPSMSEIRNYLVANQIYRRRDVTSRNFPFDSILRIFLKIWEILREIYIGILAKPPSFFSPWLIPNKLYAPQLYDIYAY